MLTGLDWAEGLLERLHAIETASVGGRFVDRIADLALDDSRRDVVRCVVAKHPQGKPEEPMVEEVVAAFRR
ncbi:MAG: hypothetical protein LLG20_05530 [Acidobacteriales bacterium]|nr:hypothetical protein [Terriglobales bacterium]